MLNSKKKILFVGVFKDASRDGSVGGQMFACKTIINSSLSDDIDWTLIDTTADSNITAGFHVRAWKAFKRVMKFFYYTAFFKHDFTLIFVADGWSFWEKGLMSLIAKFLSNSKVILAPRSGYIVNDMDSGGKLSAFIKYVFKKVDIVICQSNYWKSLFEAFVTGTDTSKYVVIENMIDFDKYEILPAAGDQKTVTILFMAWVKRNKGIFEFVEAIKLLREQNTNFKAVIAGKGDDSEKIEKEITISGLTDCVEVKGWVLGDKKFELLSKTDIFVLPTYFEGYPNSLMEAMAAGKACVATRVGSIPDMINNMQTGILIDKQNHVQLFEALRLLVENPDLRQKLSTRAKKHVEETNSMNAGILKFKEILK